MNNLSLIVKFKMDFKKLLKMMKTIKFLLKKPMIIIATIIKMLLKINI